MMGHEELTHRTGVLTALFLPHWLAAPAAGKLRANVSRCERGRNSGLRHLYDGAHVKAASVVT